MSDTPENNTQAPDTQPQEGQESNAEAEGKTFDADYVDKLRKEAAKYRTEAKANAKRAEEASKTEAALTAATERAEQAEAEAAAVPAKVAQSLREHLSRVHGITDEQRDLYLTSDDPDTLLRQVEGLAASKRERVGYVPTQGTGQGATVSGYDLGREDYSKAKSSTTP